MGTGRKRKVYTRPVYGPEPKPVTPIGAEWWHSQYFSEAVRNMEFAKDLEFYGPPPAAPTRLGLDWPRTAPVIIPSETAKHHRCGYD